MLWAVTACRLRPRDIPSALCCDIQTDCKATRTEGLSFEALERLEYKSECEFSDVSPVTRTTQLSYRSNSQAFLSIPSHLHHNDVLRFSPRPLHLRGPR